jgi:hypothetical protein
MTMQALISKTLIIALAALISLATLDAASARTKKHHVHYSRSAGEAAFWSGVRTEHGTPIIMKGYHPPAPTSSEPVLEKPPQERADRPVRIPRGSSTYIPPVNPSPYSANSPPAAALTRLPPAPYQPAPITTFSDRVNSAIQAYPLEKGIGNNPTDPQMFLRQRLNQP